MNSKTLEANSIPIPPHLAGLLKQALGRTGTGFDEGAFLQQLHYWTLNSATSGWMVDGVKWIFNSLKSWQQQFPWMSEYGLRKAIANLKKLGLIKTAQHWISQYKRVMFYRIDYERLNAFAGASCDLITPRCVGSDQVDEPLDHTTHTETSSNTSYSEQQTAVVLEKDRHHQSANSVKAGNDRASEIETGNFKTSPFTPHSSGNNPEVRNDEFPELIEAVAQAIAYPPDAPFPTALKNAIAQFPDRVQPAIAYLNYQKQRREIKNSSSYLYQAIIEGWQLKPPLSSTAVVPHGFSKWFDWAKEQGFVIAAMTINGVHHTLHVRQGWIPTSQLMQEFNISN